MDTKWDIEIFIGENDFRLWKENIQVVLIQQKEIKKFFKRMEKRTSGAEECMVQLVDCLKDQGQLDAMGFLKGRN
ncbi:hypothetical protein MTR_2g069410 [Medicago truncatula]|uniref:Uncharacterized protein n=1 Tax=Medicago truncatula TaxID=3880 RepID=G7IH43_MEDTR|nr:hypothetical protein MTR_2g069410 [Medicago truncatula]